MDITTYKKENMYLSQTSNLHSTYTIYRMPKWQESIPALHLTCTLSPENPQTLFQTTFLTKIGDHYIAFLLQAKPESSPEAKRTKEKKARKETPRKKHVGKEESEKTCTLRWG